MDLKNIILRQVSHSRSRITRAEVADRVSELAGVSGGTVKRAMNELVLEGKLEYAYYGQSFVALPLPMHRSVSNF